MKNININIKYLQMDKAHLRRLQTKVNKLMKQSSDDSDEQKIHIPSLSIQPQADNPETVRKCITLINENRQLKALLQKQKNKNEKVTQELLKIREQKSAIEKSQHEQILEFRRYEKNDSVKDEMRKAIKFQAEVEEWKKKCKQMDEMLKLQRKKCYKLSNFIRKQVPKLQETITILTARLDSKLQAHLLKQFDL